MKSIVFFLEELSARRMLEGVLPRLIPSDELQLDAHYKSPDLPAWYRVSLQDTPEFLY